MSLLDNIENVSFTIRYPIDKIIAQGAGSFAIQAASFIDTPVTIGETAPHGLTGGSIIVSGMYTIDNSNYYPLGTTIFGSVVSGQVEQAYCNVAMDDTNVFVRATNAFLSAKTFNLTLFFESIA